MSTKPQQGIANVVCLLPTSEPAPNSILLSSFLFQLIVSMSPWAYPLSDKLAKQLKDFLSLPFCSRQLLFDVYRQWRCTCDRMELNVGNGVWPEYPEDTARAPALNGMRYLP